MVKPITKYAVTVTEPSEIKYHLGKAVFLARHGRPGPVWIDVPLDVQGSMIKEASLKRFNPRKSALKEKHPVSINELVLKMIELFNKSERPVILVGNGVRLANGIDDFKKLINKLGIPVLTTWKTVDFLPENHELYFGRPGSIGQRGANFIQQNSDFILVLGTRLDLTQVGHSYQNFARGARKVVVDIDETEIKKMKMRIDVSVTADAKGFLTAFIQNLDKVKSKDRSEWLNRCKRWKEKYPVVLPEFWQEKEYVNTYVLIDVLSDLLGSNDVIVPGSSGTCSEITFQTFRVKEGQRMLNTPGLGSMGFGLPASIGACIASGGKRTVSIIGDGGLQHNIQELETLKRLQLPVKIFILNNSGYASIRMTQTRHFNGHLVCCDSSSGLTLPDTCKVAVAYGISTSRLENHSDIKEKVRKILDGSGPEICEVMVHPMLAAMPRLSSEVKPDGRIVSKPMEDLWPFLGREEFRENMIIKPLDE